MFALGTPVSTSTGRLVDLGLSFDVKPLPEKPVTGKVPATHIRNEPRGGTSGFRPVEVLLPNSNMTDWSKGAQSMSLLIYTVYMFETSAITFYYYLFFTGGDMWSVGVVMLSLLTGKEHPFRGKGMIIFVSKK